MENRALQDESLVSFIKTNKPAQRRKNKLDVFEEQILFLKDNGYSDNQIVDFLRTEKQLHTTQQAVNQFVHRRKDKKQMTPQKKATTTATAVVTPKNKTADSGKTTFVIKRKPLSELI